MNWTGRKVLVTGAGGFIGSHLTEHLVRAGATVRAMVQYNSLGTWEWLDTSDCKDDIEVIAGDVTDAGMVSAAMKDIDTAFHLAALIAIPYSYRAPQSYVQTNITGTLNVLLAARDAGVRRIVHTSTSEVYGTAQYVPIDEAHPLQGQSPYSASKIGADKMAEAFHASYGLPVTILRPFNTYGPRQSARAVIPTIISQYLAGDTARLGGLTPTRDFTFVDDTVRGFLLAAAAPDAVGRTINLGVGQEISISDLADLIGKVMGRRPAVEQEADRMRPANSEVERLLSNNDLARRLLGWQPQIPLAEGLQRTIAWIGENAHWYRTGQYAI